MCRPLAANCRGKALPDRLDGAQPEADPLPAFRLLGGGYGEFAFALVDVGRKQRNAETLRLQDIFGHFRRVFQHGGKQRRKILRGIMAQ